MEERIQKIISAAGITSRRAAEQLITEGRVRVNGQVVTELGSKADPSKDHIKVDGKLINPRQPLTYIMLNKPAGFVTTMSDPEGRPTVQHLLKGVKIRVYPVGRLDFNTEGLLLLTNDGDFAHLITHPKHEFPKTYRAKVKGVLEDQQIAQLEQGIYLDDGKTAPARIKKASKEEANSWLEITIHEGRKRQVRRMFDRVGHSVIKLKRIRTGNLTLGDLPEGSFRYLTPDEVQAMRDLALKEQKPETRRPEGAAKEAKLQGPGSRGRGPSAAVGFSRREVKGREGDQKTRRPEERTPAREFDKKKEGRWKTQEPRVPGQGASGRGPRKGPSLDRAHQGTGRTIGAVRRGEYRKPIQAPGAAELGASGSGPRKGPSIDRVHQGEGRTIGAVRRGEDRRPTQAPRVAGLGASSRGPRRPLRDAEDSRGRHAGFKGHKTGSGLESKEKSWTRTATARPVQGAFDRGPAKSPAFGPKGKKTTAQRMRGKIFDGSASQKPGAERAQVTRSGERKPPRAFERHTAGKSTVQGAGRKPYRTKK